MQLKNLFTDDSAVSPVIGVILMVAITVILAAVIGTFVLDLGQSVQQTAPQASFDYDYDTDNQTVNITHQAGDSLNNATISIAGDGNSSISLATPPDGSFEAGDEVAFGDYNTDGTIRVVWTSPNGDNSATLGQSSTPTS